MQLLTQPSFVYICSPTFIWQDGHRGVGLTSSPGLGFFSRFTSSSSKRLTKTVLPFDHFFAVSQKAAVPGISQVELSASRSKTLMDLVQVSVISSETHASHVSTYCRAGGHFLTETLLNSSK